MFKVIIAGNRTFEDYSLLKERCDYYLQNHDEIEIISGGARGADFLGERYAVDSGYKLSKFVADWTLVQRPDHSATGRWQNTLTHL